MPASLECFRMNLFWDQVMVGQGNPVTQTNLAVGGARRRPQGWWICNGRNVVCEDRYEKVGKRGGIGEEGIGDQRVGDRRWDRDEDAVHGSWRKRIAILPGK